VIGVIQEDPMFSGSRYGVSIIICVSAKIAMIKKEEIFKGLSQ
jgi:hypothetical protein